MICLSNVVKATAVVDNRPVVQKTFADKIEENLGNMPVIKRQVFSYSKNPYSDQTLILPDKQGYLDELNRIKVEIAQAKDELRKLGHMLDEPEVEEEEEAEIPAETEDGFDPEAAMRHMKMAQEEAQQLLQETKSNIEMMMRGAEEEGRRMAEEAKNHGYLEGFEQGFSQAMNEFKTEREPQIKELENLLEQISSYREEQVAVNERELTSLAITVAQKVIGQEIKAEPRTVTNMLYQALDDNRREENIRVTVSPDLMPVEAKASAEVKKLIAQAAPGTVIYVDGDADPGFCKVETDKGITDLSVDTQLENIRKMLTED